MKTIFEKSQKGQHAFSLPRSTKEFDAIHPPADELREELALPEVSELDLTRHFCELARRNMGKSTPPSHLLWEAHTMKLNPRMNEVCAAMPGIPAALTL